LQIFFTGKGDAMSGGGGAVRTSFKGKASFDDQIFRVTLMLGGSFLVAMVVLDMLAARIWK
jgi:preprotein translocase subunit SecG